MSASRAMAELHNRHTDECLSHQTDPGATCICRPPATVEPMVRPSRAGITRGTLELPTCSVSVLVTQTEAGAHVVSAMLWTKADEAPRVETFRRGTRRAAWEAFAAWVAGVIS